ncbi:hypothetical protein DFQ30_001303 [Apophysomyces sp. BC1015]|nr:hypothetical protein DFQ30_001303 [Apophysomyces sp. BC1015]
MIEKPNTLEEGANRSYTSGKADDLEHTYSYTSRHSEEHYEETDLQRGTKRGLSARHIQMISLGGAIGTGLFLNSGQNIAAAGPAGALIAYCVGTFKKTK